MKLFSLKAMANCIGSLVDDTTEHFSECCDFRRKCDFKWCKSVEQIESDGEKKGIKATKAISVVLFSFWKCHKALSA